MRGLTFLRSDPGSLALRNVRRQRALARIVSNPSPEHFKRAIHVGQQATWPKVSQIEIHCKIELALDAIVQELRGCELWSLN